MKYVKLLESFSEERKFYPPSRLLPEGEIKYLYRTVKQPDMFIDCYGEDMSKSDLLRWCYSDKGKPSNEITPLSEIFIIM